MYWVHRWTSSCKEIRRSLRKINTMYPFPPTLHDLFRKLGTKKKIPDGKALWSGRITFRKQCTTCKFTNKHHSSGLTRRNKLLPACLPLHIFLCVTRSRWDKAPSVLELHLPSRKDNQLTGVFNLKYSHWPMERSAQPLHKGKDWTWWQSLTGEHVSSVLRVCRPSLLSDSEVVMAHDVVWFLKFSCTAGSVKGLCRRLNSSSQHCFAEPTVAWNVFSGHWFFFFQWRWEAWQMREHKEQIKAVGNQ